MNLIEARGNMIKQQFRTWDIVDENLLAVFTQLPREDFIPDAERELAFADMPLPLAHGQYMLTPREEARVLQAVAIQPNERVLEIGTGTGYFTALLASQAKHVESVDIFADFTENATQKLSARGIRNVTLQTADASRGYRSEVPYDVIVITGALPGLPKAYCQQLAVGGRLFVIIGQAPIMEAVLVRKTAENNLQQQRLFQTFTPLLVHAPLGEQFVF